MLEKKMIFYRKLNIEEEQRKMLASRETEGQTERDKDKQRERERKKERKRVRVCESK